MTDINYQLKKTVSGEIAPGKPAWLAIISDIAAAQQGGRLGFASLQKYIKDQNPLFFERFPVISIEDQLILPKQGGDGNLPIRNKTAGLIEYVNQLQRAVRDELRYLRSKRMFPLIVSGDHSSVIGIVSGIKHSHPNDEIGIVYIDAHADFHSPYTTPSGNMHGMCLSMVCGLDHEDIAVNQPDEKTVSYWNELKLLAGELPWVKPENVVFCAVRDCEPEESSVMASYSIKNYTVNDIRNKGIKTAVQSILGTLKQCDQLIISFDVDSMSPDVAPGTGTPVKDGLNPDEASMLCRLLIREKKVCCFEMTELNPTKDRDNITVEHTYRLLEAVTEDLLKYY